MVGPFYAVFVAVWVYLRHYQNMRIIASLFTEFRTVGPYELNWETQQYKCLLSNIITLVLLSALQALNLFWLYCVLRNGHKFVVYKSRKDDRSEESEAGEAPAEFGSTTARVGEPGVGIANANDDMLSSTKDRHTGR